MITKTGELVDQITMAAEQGCLPTTDVVVRIGTLGPKYRINMLKGVRDQRGSRLLIELEPFPEAG